MAETGGAEPGKPPPVVSLERALDQVCDFLSRAEQSARVRALVIEARRLRNVVGNWRSITPEADVREEMIARVLRLANDAEDVVAAERASANQEDVGAQADRRNAPVDPNGPRSLVAGLRLGPAQPLGGPPPAKGPPPGAAMFLADLAKPTGPVAPAGNAPHGVPALPPGPGLAGPSMSVARTIDLGATLSSPGLLPGPHAPPHALPGPEGALALQRGGRSRDSGTLQMDRGLVPPGRDVSVYDPQAMGGAAPPPDRSLASTIVSPPSLVIGAAQPAPGREPPAAAPKPMERSLTSTFASPPSLVFDRVVPPAQREVAVREAPAPQPPTGAPMPMERSLTGTFASPPSLVFDRIVPPPGLGHAVEAKPQPRPVDDGFESPPSLHLDQIRPPSGNYDHVAPLSEFGSPGGPDPITVRALPFPESVDPRLVMIRAPYSPQADAYRTLRRKLSAGTATTIAVTSALPGEGKTSCAINLALALRETTRSRILVVEANIRAPGIAAILKFEPPRCFTEQLLRHRDDRLAPWVVVEQAAPTASAQPGDEGADSSPERSSPSGGRSAEPRHGSHAPVHILAVDPQSDRPPMLDAVAFSAGIESLKRAGYAYIIIDTPPVLGSMDMNVIGDSVDGVVLTSVVKKSTRKSLRQAIERLRPAPVLGVVLLEP